MDFIDLGNIWSGIPSGSGPEYLKKERKTILDDVRRILLNRIGVCGWFISGSSANPNVDFNDVNDIDMFFTDRHALLRSVQLMKKYVHRDVVILHETNNAITMSIRGVHHSLQLVKKHVGGVEEIMDTMDLNVCKYAIMPNGKLITHPSTKDPIAVVKPSLLSFSRLVKYSDNLNLCTYTTLKRAIDQYIEDDTELEDYYGGVNYKSRVNIKLKESVINNRFVKPLKGPKDHTIYDYFFEKALEVAPELLV